MNMLSSFIVFDVLIIIYELLIEIFSALYEISGLTKEQARFQVTSLLTGTGFTTSESEKMLSTKKRRRVTRCIMMVSYIFNISIVSTLVTLLTSTKSANVIELIIGLILSLVILIIVFFSRKIIKIRKLIDRLIMKVIKKLFYKKQNQIIIYEYYGKKILAEVKIDKMPRKIKDKEIKISDIYKDYDIKILYIKRKNRIISELKENTKIYRKDILVMLGEKNHIVRLLR